MFPLIDIVESDETLVSVDFSKALEVALEFPTDRIELSSFFHLYPRDSHNYPDSPLVVSDPGTSRTPVVASVVHPSRP